MDAIETKRESSSSPSDHSSDDEVHEKLHELLRMIRQRKRPATEVCGCTTADGVEPQSMLCVVEQPSEAAEDKSYIPLESSLDPALHLLQHEPVSKSASIHSGIIPIWSLILKTGLTEDAADTLVTKYPPATNCPLMAAPKLNSEIVASVNETALRRLFRVEEAQTMMGASLSALGQAITEIINKSVSKTRLLTLLGDAASLIAAVHYRNTAIRRQIMKSQLRCEILDTLDKTSDDSFLFGGNRGAEVESSEGLKKFAQPNGFTGNNGASKNYKEQSGSPSKKRRQRERKRSYPNCKENCERER